ncbi:hypothetical protein [Candidatus Hikarchaeum yamanae]|uniref:hypothetical protein n=1 Tax=Candidatus Hikarchaeum yamanae TaxID=2675326 RepID=UPI0039E92140|tara:strand:+ start:15717 stop:15890 length:174 start_codon:yes stop_codon:yes gene_type:complete
MTFISPADGEIWNFKCLFLLFIIAGSIALITAAGSFVAEKGREWHARVGKIYSFATG